VSPDFHAVNNLGEDTDFYCTGVDVSSLLAEALFLVFADGRKEPLLAGKDVRSAGMAQW